MVAVRLCCVLRSTFGVKFFEARTRPQPGWGRWQHWGCLACDTTTFVHGTNGWHHWITQCWHLTIAQKRDFGGTDRGRWVTSVWWLCVDRSELWQKHRWKTRVIHTPTVVSYLHMHPQLETDSWCRRRGVSHPQLPLDLHRRMWQWEWRTRVCMRGGMHAAHAARSDDQWNNRGSVSVELTPAAARLIRAQMRLVEVATGWLVASVSAGEKAWEAELITDGVVTASSASSPMTRRRQRRRHHFRVTATAPLRSGSPNVGRWSASTKSLRHIVCCWLRTAPPDCTAAPPLHRSTTCRLAPLTLVTLRWMPRWQCHCVM